MEVSGKLQKLSFLKENWISLLVFFVLIVHGSSLGLSDDEAYYWVLSQKLAFGYAYHPPAVAWTIWIFRKLFGWMTFISAESVVRLPAALICALLIKMALTWLQEVGLNPKAKSRAALVLLSFFGFFSLSWMMVPDLPLFLGWMMIFVSTWRICYPNNQDGSHFHWNNNFLKLGFGTTLALLSKYSAVLAIGSSAISLLLWAPKQKRIKGCIVLLFATVLACVPVLIWNSQHEWASILYQIRDRHGQPAYSALRYLRFWLIEMILVGPVAIILGLGKLFNSLRKPFWKASQEASNRVSLYLAIWVLPAATVFCIQPLFSDFKAHWAFIVWWPMMLGLALASQTQAWRWLKYQCIYGLSLGALVLVCCQWPLLSFIGHKISGANFDPRFDVTNDFYGWRDLPQFLNKELNKELKAEVHSKLSVIGSRYQTASQASFYISSFGQATLLPRDIKEMDEWPSLNVSEAEGPEWPRLTTPILFVTDNRYDARPEFKGADCYEWKRLEKQRYHLLAKRIVIWRCSPSGIASATDLH